MINNAECRKRFDKIILGIENESYTSWERWVLEQIKDCNEEQILNMIKRIELKLKIVSIDEDFKTFPIMGHFGTILLTLIPFLGGFIITSFNIQIEAYKTVIADNDMYQFAEILNNTITKLGTQITTMACIYALVIFVFIVIAKLWDSHSLKKRYKDRIYYEELLKVLSKKTKDEFLND